MKTRCRGVKDNPRYHKGADFGQQCRLFASKGDAFCPAHRKKADWHALPLKVKEKRRRRYARMMRYYRRDFWGFLPADENGRRYLCDGIYV